MNILTDTLITLSGIIAASAVVFCLFWVLIALIWKDVVSPEE